MKIEKKEIQRIEYKNIYIANDGTEFSTAEECKKYEQTAQCAINQAFNKLPIQSTYDPSGSASFPYFGCEDTLNAVRIRDVNDLEIVNKWICSKPGFETSCLGAEAIGTIQLIVTYDYDNGVWCLGTPEELKRKYANFVDEICNKLVEKEGEKI